MEPHSSSHSRSEVSGQPGQLHVLLVEDNKADIFVVQEAFTNYEIPAVLHVVEDGEAAMRFIDDADQDEDAPCPILVLLDLNLPKRSGTEVLAYLRRSKKCARAKVLVVTSSNSPTDRAATQQLGANGYFLKPPSYDEFLKIGEIVLNTLNDMSGNG
jgi:two-component system, chemotaxis family, response regulator Rcp1